MEDTMQTITFGIIAYNEQQYLPDLLEDLLNQTYLKEKIEVIMVDGNSSDNTWKIMEKFKDDHEKEYHKIKLLHNNKRTQPAGWNMVIYNSTTDVILRIDAHARLPKNFIEKNILCLNSGEAICGGARENIIDENIPWKKILLAAEQSMFGSGVATYRKRTNEKKYVKSIFHGAYRRNVFNNVGIFNENLIRTEDNELHYRIRKAGYRICYDPEIISYYQTRNSLPKMLKQKYQNGLWIGKTLYVSPGCISLFHLVPFLFICAIIISSILCIFDFMWPTLLLWSAYGAVNFFMSVVATIKTERKSYLCLMLPLIFGLLHICYGLGTMIGIIKR